MYRSHLPSSGCSRAHLPPKRYVGLKLVKEVFDIFAQRSFACVTHRHKRMSPTGVSTAAVGGWSGDRGPVRFGTRHAAAMAAAVKYPCSSSHVGRGRLHVVFFRKGCGRHAVQRGLLLPEDDVTQTVTAAS